MCMIGAETAKVNVIAPHFGEGRNALLLSFRTNVRLKLAQNHAYKVTMVRAQSSSPGAICDACFVRITILLTSETDSTLRLKSLQIGT